MRWENTGIIAIMTAPKHKNKLFGRLVDNKKTGDIYLPSDFEL